MKVKNLDELFELMKRDDPKLGDWSSLPNFGGDQPLDTSEIWSWDEKRLIVGTCSSDIEIVERPEVKIARIAAEHVADCDAYSSVRIASGAYLETSDSMIEQQKNWDDGDGAKLVNFAQYPYWVTTDDGQMPIGISGANDSDLLQIVKDNI